MILPGGKRGRGEREFSVGLWGRKSSKSKGHSISFRLSVSAVGLVAGPKWDCSGMGIVIEMGFVGDFVGFSLEVVPNWKLFGRS
jgi:hypothetical protein